LKIIIITPATIKSLYGNRATANRWALFLRELGHTVDIAVTWDETPYDLMIALHAWRSATSIAMFAEKHPDIPLIVAMTGTDLYRFIHSHPKPTLHSIRVADKLVVLHDRAYLELPKDAWHKVTVIYQSAQPLPFPISRAKRTFDVCVVGHLRDEKDPLRAAYAVRDLPENSRIRVLHYGKPHTPTWKEKTLQEMKINARYRWVGEVKHWQVRQAYARCHFMVLSSNMEGGANVISEAAVAGLPVLASKIEGSVGLLGENYNGYYPMQDTQALRTLLLKVENEPNFVQQLKQQIDQKAKLFKPKMECQQWQQLLQKIGL
jgi:putative glycosyltransferase (TIGR04348 family)